MAYVAFVLYTLASFGRGPFVVAVLFIMLFLISHNENFKRIMNKEELKISTMFRREAS